MRRLALILALATPLAATARPAAPVAAAIADPARPAEDKARDDLRKPAELLAFAGIRPGIKIGELLPGGGYFTRIFAKAVAPRGKVHAWLPAAIPDKYVARFEPVTKAYANVTLQRGAVFSAPEPLDLVWTSQNYHDLYLNGGNATATNAAVFKALKPGGVYLVVDHRGNAGTGTSEAGTLHRIEESRVITDAEKAGFVLADESMALRRADDDHTAKVFDLHDRTDQLVLKFVKPR
jgi:predicted methyltransferase